MERFLGKVIGEFVCDDIFMMCPGYNGNCGDDCLTFDEQEAYLGDNGGFGWHISGLKIYDRPKELSEFSKPCNRKCFDPCPYYRGEEYECDRPTITKPPQSWCYCESGK